MLKRIGLVVRDAELTEKKFHPKATASAHITTPVTIITTSITTAVTKAFISSL